MKILFEVVEGVEGHCLYMGDESGGHRLAGPKPWGGGEVVNLFEVDVTELKRELELLIASQGENNE